MALLTRVAIYVVVLFLIMIVFTGQHHDNGRAILRDSVQKTVKYLVWTAVLVLVMELCFWLFIG